MKGSRVEELRYKKTCKIGGCAPMVLRLLYLRFKKLWQLTVSTVSGASLSTSTSATLTVCVTALGHLVSLRYFLWKNMTGFLNCFFEWTQVLHPLEGIPFSMPPGFELGALVTVRGCQCASGYVTVGTGSMSEIAAGGGHTFHAH